MKIFWTIITLILLPPLAWGLGASSFALYALNQKPNAPAQDTQAIVVLTGGHDRIEEGLALYAQGRAPQLFITGVHTDVKMHEIRALYKGDIPLPTCCITLGYEARSTVQNGIETKAWLDKTGFTSIRLVTGNYHMPRAYMELSKVLPNTEIYTHPVKQQDLKLNHELLRNLLLSEFHKSIYRFIILTFGIERA